MTKNQREKIINYLLNGCRDWVKKWETDGIIHDDTKSRVVLFGNDKLPVKYDGSCALINERLVNPMLLELFVQSVDERPPRVEFPVFEPASDDLPRFRDSQRHYFVRMMYGISNRLLKLEMPGDNFIFDDKYLIQDSGAVCGWHWDESKPIKLQEGQTISALDYELTQMLKELSKKLKYKDYYDLQTEDGLEFVSIKQAFKMLAKVHGDSND